MKVRIPTPPSDPEALRDLETGGSFRWVDTLDSEALKALLMVHAASEWHEDYGDVLWWHFPACGPPYIGCGESVGEKDEYGELTECARLQREGWLTHWSRIPVVWDGDGNPLHLSPQAEKERTCPEVRVVESKRCEYCGRYDPPRGTCHCGAR